MDEFKFVDLNNLQDTVVNTAKELHEIAKSTETTEDFTSAVKEKYELENEQEVATFLFEVRLADGLMDYVLEDDRIVVLLMGLTGLEFKTFHDVVKYLLTNCDMGHLFSIINGNPDMLQYKTEEGS